MSKIKVKQLSVSYGNHEVLKNISLEIPERQIIAVIGPSGCGKTTLLKSMNRLLELNEDVAVSGDIYIDGTSIYHAETDVTCLRKRSVSCPSTLIRCPCPFMRMSPLARESMGWISLKPFPPSPKREGGERKKNVRWICS